MATYFLVSRGTNHRVADTESGEPIQIEEEYLEEMLDAYEQRFYRMAPLRPILVEEWFARYYTPAQALKQKAKSGAPRAPEYPPNGPSTVM